MSDLTDALTGVIRSARRPQLGRLDWMQHGADALAGAGRDIIRGPHGLTAMFDPRTKEGLLNIAATAAGVGAGGLKGAGEEEALIGEQPVPAGARSEAGSHALRGGGEPIYAGRGKRRNLSFGELLASPFVDTAHWARQGALAAAHGVAAGGHFLGGLSHRSNIDWQVQHIAASMRERGVPHDDSWRIANRIAFQHDISDATERDKGIRLAMNAWKAENRAKQQRPGAR